MSSVVHGGRAWYGIAVAEVADTDGRVGAIGDGEGSRVCWFEAARRRSRRELGVPENGRCSCELTGNAQRRGGARGRGNGG